MADPRGEFNPERTARLRSFVTELGIGLRNLGFYDSTHPVVGQTVGAAHEMLMLLLAERPSVVLKFVGGEVVEDERPLFNLKGPVLAFVAACQQQGIGCLTFLRGVPAGELRVLLEVVGESAERLKELGGPNATLRARGVVHIGGEGLVDVEQVTEDETPAVPSVVPKAAYGAALEAARRAMVSVRVGERVDQSAAALAVHDLTTAVLHHPSAMMGLASVRGMDEYTFSHIVHICVLVLQLGAYLGLSDAELESLGLSALLHDVGKVFLPIEILRKQGRLTPSETAVVQQHPSYGALVLSRQGTHFQSIPLVAFEHHMRFDQQGYPRVKRPRTLHPYSLIVSVPDVYDALTTDRPYRLALTPHAALGIMDAGQPGQFEPELLAMFKAMLGPYPAGSLVRLNDGRLAIVTRPNHEDRETPWVRVVTDERRTNLYAGEDTLLSELPRRNGALRIVESLEDYPSGLRPADLVGLPEEMEF